MNEELDKNIQKQFNTLPQELQKAILAIDLPEKLQRVTKNSKLLIDKAGIVQTEVLTILLGINPLDDFIGNLQKNAGLDKNTALIVAHDVDELIFKEVREELKKVSQNIAHEERVEIKEVPQTPEALNSPITMPKKEEILSGIETPATIEKKEGAISVSALPSNADQKISMAASLPGIEILKENLPAIEKPEAILPTVLPQMPKDTYHETVSPVSNIVESKMMGELIIPKENVVVEEKIKLPSTEKKLDPYREIVG